MSKPVTINFTRDEYQDAACLEYSWVPEGKRRVIQLHPGDRTGTQTDSVADDLHPSHVQVYTLNSNNRVGLTMWQFPTIPGPEIGKAFVNVIQARLEAIGEVQYDDGTLGPPSSMTLYTGQVQCPEIS